MSASSNKKLRTEQDTSKLTERQIAEQQEAKKVKMYTIAFGRTGLPAGHCRIRRHQPVYPHQRRE